MRCMIYFRLYNVFKFMHRNGWNIMESNEYTRNRESSVKVHKPKEKHTERTVTQILNNPVVEATKRLITIFPLLFRYFTFGLNWMFFFSSSSLVESIFVCVVSRFKDKLHKNVNLNRCYTWHKSTATCYSKFLFFLFLFYFNIWFMTWAILKSIKWEIVVMTIWYMIILKLSSDTKTHAHTNIREW